MVPTDLKQAVKLLKGSLKNLAKQEGVNSVETLRAAVKSELKQYYSGENPITQAQVTNLHEFLNKTERR